jgi:hypothetical protein
MLRQCNSRQHATARARHTHGKDCPPLVTRSSRLDLSLCLVETLGRRRDSMSVRDAYHSTYMTGKSMTLGHFTRQLGRNEGVLCHGPNVNGWFLLTSVGVRWHAEMIRVGHGHCEFVERVARYMVTSSPSWQYEMRIKG